MMQQIAAPKTEIATGVMPLDGSIDTTQGDQFSAVMRDANKTVLDPSTAKAHPSRDASQDASNASVKDKTISHSGKSQDIEPKRTDNVGDKQNSEHSVDVNSSGANADDNTADNSIDNSASQSSETAGVDGTPTNGVDEREHVEIAEQTLVGKQVNTQDDAAAGDAPLLFNYVEFVTQVKLINDDSVQNQNEVTTAVMSSTAASAGAIIATLGDDSMMISTPELNQLSAGEAPSELTFEQQIEQLLAKLNQAVGNNDGNSTQDLDKRQLIDLVKANAIVDANVPAQATPTANAGAGQLAAAGSGDLSAQAQLTTQLTGAMQDDAQALTGATLVNADAAEADVIKATLPTAATEAADTIELAAKPLSAAPELVSQLVDDASKPKGPLEFGVGDTKASAEKAMHNLSALTEQAELDSLKNLTQRVAQVVTEIAQDTPKGNDLIAALKAGVKEFKAQLAEGREPGIDLKALVIEASEKAGISINVQQANKLEPSLQQFANILNMAVSAQPQAQSSQQLVYSPIDAASVDSVSQPLTEAAKSLNQQTSSAALDKAINIMKPDGQQQMLDRVRWMISGRNSAAEIRLDPPDLGSMQVRINMSGDTASVSFVVQSQQAKDVFDMAVPRLKDMFNEQGIELGQSSVQQESRGQQERDGGFNGESENSGQSLHAMTTASDEPEPNTQVVTQRIAGTSIGGIDFYA